MDYIVDTVFYISFISAGIATFYGIKLVVQRQINLLVFLVAVSFLADVINALNTYYYTVLGIDLGIRNVGVMYRIIEYSILISFFNAFHFDRRIKYLLVSISFVLIVGFILLHPDFLENYIDSTPIRISSAVIVIIFGMLFYKRTITKMNIPNIETWPPFYLISALFIYFSGVLMALILQFPIMKMDRLLGNYLLTFHNAWLVIRNVLLIIGFYFTYKTKYKWEPISLT